MGFTFDGKIKSYDIKLYSNAGNTMDVSKKVGLFFLLDSAQILYGTLGRVCALRCKIHQLHYDLVKTWSFSGFLGTS